MAIKTGYTTTVLRRKAKDGEKGQDGKDGKDGVSPAVYKLVPSVTSIKKDSNGDYFPQTLSISIAKTIDGVTSNPASYQHPYYWSRPNAGDLVIYINNGYGKTGYSYNVEDIISNSTIILGLSLCNGSDEAMTSLDSVTIPVVSDGQNGQDGEDGNDGDPGDPVMPNLFGYDTWINQDCFVHTKTGMAGRPTLIGTSEGDHYQVFLRKASGDVKWDAGTYALSGKIKSDKAISVKLGADNIQATLGGNRKFAVPANTEVSFAWKFRTSTADAPYWLFYGSAVATMIEIYDLKFEHAEDINGICTPFAGLAEDTIPQMPNMLIDTKFKFTKYWATQYGSSMANMLQGQQGWVFNGISNVYIGASADTSVVPEDWVTEGVYLSSSNPILWVKFNYGSFNHIIYLNSSHFMTGYAYRRNLQFSLNGTDYTRFGSYGDNIAPFNHIRYQEYDSSTLQLLYLDFLQQEITGRLKPNTWYTLSYWHKSSGSGQLSTYINPDVGVNGGVTVIDDAATQSKTDNYHAISSADSPTAWKRHTITFKTASYFGSGYKHYLLFRSHDFYQHQICMPKLEECEKATDFCVNDEDLSGAFLRNRDKYDSANTYEYNEEFRDFCFTQTKDGSGNDVVAFYVLKKKGSYGYGSNALPEYGKNNDVWLSQPMTAMTATDILLTNQMYAKVLSAVNARINDLTVKRLVTMVTGGAYISIQDGLLDVYANGSSKPNIQFGVDESGYAVLKYYDMAGNLLYNLGPQGIMGLTSVTMARYQSFTMAATGITSGSTNVGSLLGHTLSTYHLWAEGLLKVGSVYKYHAYMTGTVTGDMCQNNHYTNTGKVMTTQASNGVMPTSVISDGYYLMGPAIDTSYSEIFTRQVRYYEGGKVASSFNLYLLNKQNTTYVVDTNGNRVINNTIEKYIELTQGTLPRD